MTDPQSIPVSGEQHERAVEAAARAIHAKLPPGAQFGPALNVLDEIYFSALAIDAYLTSLREQGVVLVDLREVVAWLRNFPSRVYEDMPHDPVMSRRAVDMARAADFIERRFGGNDRIDP